MKKLVALFLLLQIANVVFGMKKQRQGIPNKGTLVYNQNSINICVGETVVQKNCSLLDLIEEFASGRDFIRMHHQNNWVDIPMSRKNWVEVLQQSIPQFPKNIYDINQCTVLQPHQLSEYILSDVASNTTGSLKTGWPLGDTNNFFIAGGFTIEADEKKYYICETVNQEINSKLEYAIINQKPFVFSLCSTTNPQETFNLLINDFSRAAQPTEIQQNINSIPDKSNADDYFDFDVQDDLTQPESAKPNKSINMSSLSISWKNLLYIGIPVGIIALICVLWKQNLLKLSL